MLKLTTDKQTDRQTNKQTGQKQYDPDHSIRGHKKITIMSVNYYLENTDFPKAFGRFLSLQKCTHYIYETILFIQYIKLCLNGSIFTKYQLVALIYGCL